MRVSYRIHLNHTEREIWQTPNVILSWHPSETREHLSLKVLAYCMFYEEAMEFGPGICIGGAPDLLCHDLSGVPTEWIFCGNVDLETLRKSVQHHKSAKVRVLMRNAEKYEALMANVRAGRGPRRDLDRLEVILLEQSFLTELAMNDSPRQEWDVTIVDGHIYVKTETTLSDSAIKTAVLSMA